MKRKPDILVILAALLGIGMILSSFSSANIVEVKNIQVEVVAVK